MFHRNYVQPNTGGHLVRPCSRGSYHHGKFHHLRIGSVTCSDMIRFDKLFGHKVGRRSIIDEHVCTLRAPTDVCTVNVSKLACVA